MSPFPFTNQGWSRVSFIEILSSLSLQRSSKLIKIIFKIKTIRNCELTWNTVFCLSRDILPNWMRELNLLVNGFPSYLSVIIWVERQVSREHQVDYNAEWPTVNALVIRLLKQNFRSHVAKCTEWFTASFARPECFTQPKVNKFDLGVTTSVHHQNILRF